MLVGDHKIDLGKRASFDHAEGELVRLGLVRPRLFGIGSNLGEARTRIPRPTLAPRDNGKWLEKRGGQDPALTDIPDEHVLIVMEWWARTSTGRAMVGMGPSNLVSALGQVAYNDYNEMSSARRQSSAAARRSLLRLTRAGKIEEVPDTRPKRYRLAATGKAIKVG